MFLLFLISPGLKAGQMNIQAVFAGITFWPELMKAWLLNSNQALKLKGSGHAGRSRRNKECG